MPISTESPANLSSHPAGTPTSIRPGERLPLTPIERYPETTITLDAGPNTDRLSEKEYDPPFATVLPPVSADSTPLQIWEGSVSEVDHNAQVMHVVLDAKIGQMPRHTAEIELQWVTEQDRDLVRPGAVFYLTLFKRTKRGSIENAQDLRFRRRPSWSSAQLEEIRREADILLAKMKPLPTSE